MEQFDQPDSYFELIQRPSDVDRLVDLLTPRTKAHLRGMDYNRHFAAVFFHGRRSSGDYAVKMTKVIRVGNEISFTADFYDLKTSLSGVAQSSSPYEVVKVEKNQEWPTRLAINYHVERVHLVTDAAQMPQQIYETTLPPNIETITVPKGIELEFDLIERRKNVFLGEWLYESLDPDLSVISREDNIEKVEKYITRVAVSDLMASIDNEAFFALLVFQGKKDATAYELEVERIMQDETVVNVFAKFIGAKPGHAQSDNRNSPYLLLRVKKNPTAPSIRRFNLIVDTMVVAKQAYEIP